MARRGRKVKFDAKRRKTTKLGQGRCSLDLGTPEQQERRKKIGGSAVFPLDVLLQIGAITPDEHAAGWRYAKTAWGIFGHPWSAAPAGCAMVSEPVQADPDADPPMLPQELQEREETALPFFRDMRTAVNRHDGPYALAVLDDAAQYLVMPAAVVDLIAGRVPEIEAARALKMLKKALSTIALVQRPNAKKNT